MTIKAVLFDFDDTLTVPGKLDFKAIRTDIGCPEDQSILDFIHSIADHERREAAAGILDRYEMDAAAAAQPAPGSEELISLLKQHGLERGIITRNSRAAVGRSLSNFGGTYMSDFGIIITRDDPIPVKPAPDGVFAAAKFFNISAADMLVVGDYIYDIEAGNSAGAVTVFLEVRKDKVFTPPVSTYKTKHLLEIARILRLEPT
jgi:hydrogenase expression/formation protein HypE